MMMTFLAAFLFPWLFLRATHHLLERLQDAIFLFTRSTHQTSLLLVKTPSFNDSGAIHRTGSKP